MLTRSRDDHLARPRGERSSPAAGELHDHPGGWNRSRRTTAPRLTAWLSAIGVVAALAAGLYALYY